MKKLALSLATVFALAACGAQDKAPADAKPAAAATATDQPATPPPPKSAEQLFAEHLDAVLAGSWRSDANRARDVYRHPKETLAFFGAKPGQTVIEMVPGAGWYSEILAPLYKGNGHYVAALIDPASAAKEGTKNYLAKGNEGYRGKLAGDAERYGEVEVREFAMGAPQLGPDNSADLVLTFRNVHNFLMWNADQAYFDAMFRVLKPGGVLGVTDHRAAPGADLASIKESGYIPEDYVIGLATKAGFRLEGRSEVNANPKDTKDYADGVWTLPPTLARKEQDKDKYLAIGESDRMTLKFVKPAEAAAPAAEAKPAEAPKQ